MASFTDKIDWFGLTGDSIPLFILSDDDGGSNEYNEYKAQNGALTDSITFGAKKAPSNEFGLSGDLEQDDGAPFKLGGVNTVSSKKYGLEKISISTTAGELPSISVSGKQLEDAATEAAWYVVPDFTLANDESAQILWSAFTLTGADCHLQTANYELGISLPTKNKDGYPRAHGVAAGYIECQITVTQCGSTVPILAAGAGWVVSDQLKCSNPDSDCPTWSATLRMFLERAAASS